MKQKNGNYDRGDEEKRIFNNWESGKIKTREYKIRSNERMQQ